MGKLCRDSAEAAAIGQQPNHMEVLLVGVEQLYVQWDESHINLAQLRLAKSVGELSW